MTQNVQLQQVRIYLMIIEVSGDHSGGCIVGRMLDRAELKDLMVVRADYNAAGMLTCGPLHAGAVRSQSVRLILVDGNPPLLEVFHYVAEGGLVRHRAYGACLEHVLFAEDIAYVAVGHRLVFAGEVKVDIRLFVPVETQEGRKRNGEAVSLHVGAADRALLRRHIDTAVVEVFVAPLHVLALRAKIVRFKRIYLGDTRHGGSKR